MKILTRGRLFSGFVGAATVAVLALTTPDAVADSYPSPGGGRLEVVGAINDNYRGLGGHLGILGHPLTGELRTPNGKGRYNHFERGSIYWTPTTGAAAVMGSIKGTWAHLGWETSALGFPTSNERVTPTGHGRYNLFERGAIFWSPATGARELRGAIWNTYGALGWDRSLLGFPVSNELGTPNGKGRYNHFQAGSIYWSAATGAHGIMGAIRDRWAGLGWETSWLGFPTTEEFPVPGGRAQDFQCGSIGWTPRGGTVVVRSAACAAAVTPTPTMTVSQKNAVATARQYLDLMPFSRIDLIDQLVYEGYSTGDSTWAVDYLRVDWNREAAEAAQSYLEFMPFSRSELIDQLLFDGFTQRQAEYGVSQTGL